MGDVDGPHAAVRRAARRSTLQKRLSVRAERYAWPRVSPLLGLATDESVSVSSGSADRRLSRAYRRITSSASSVTSAKSLSNRACWSTMTVSCALSPFLPDAHVRRPMAVHKLTGIVVAYRHTVKLVTANSLARKATEQVRASSNQLRLGNLNLVSWS